MIKVRDGGGIADEQSCIELWIQALAYRDGPIDVDVVARRARQKFNQRIVRLGIVDEDTKGFALTVEKVAEDGFREAMIELLAVEPDAAGKGCGRALLLDAVERAGIAGFRRIGLEVRPGNGPAMALYRSAGFKQLGEPRTHPLGGDPMVAMALSLCRAVA